MISAIQSYQRQTSERKMKNFFSKFFLHCIFFNQKKNKMNDDDEDAGTKKNSWQEFVSF